MRILTAWRDLKRSLTGLLNDDQLAGPAIAQMRGLGLTDEQIKHRLNQTAMFAVVDAPDELVQVCFQIAARGRVTSDDVCMLKKHAADNYRVRPDVLTRAPKL